MTISWPSYARIEFTSYAEEPEAGVLTSEMETGPKKVVLIKSRVMVSRPCTVYLPTKAAYLDFLTWFKTSAKLGAAWFDWTDPVRQQVVQARIANGKLGAARPVASLGADLGWKLTLALETWQ